MRTAFTIAVLAIATTLFDVSVVPWLPVIVHAPLIGIVTTALIATRMGFAPIFGFSISATLLADAISGAPVGARTALVTAALLALQPLIRSFRRDPRAPVVIVVGAVLAFANSLGAVLGAWSLPVLQRWAELLVGWWWAVVVNATIGYFAFRVTRRFRTRT